ncbi:hypothetical protein [Chromobacterium sp. IIBBL 290-4]|uniref:hypothetical protein n=1 Tax=Chromobacterium sp. IIBBL 290-4 TaxID=2953890 RepID=UPI0020B8AE8F|nr:hypothetical protein [Chromobacterium sp. IIBBL 290-4]UTH75322.1 hypothetical protein NKT35_04255 [Chromobacterium sp. IIBBL 290-4]
MRSATTIGLVVSRSGVGGRRVAVAGYRDGRGNRRADGGNGADAESGDARGSAGDACGADSTRRACSTSRARGARSASGGCTCFLTSRKGRRNKSGGKSEDNDFLQQHDESFTQRWTTEKKEPPLPMLDDRQDSVFFKSFLLMFDMKKTFQNKAFIML